MFRRSERAPARPARRLPGSDRRRLGLGLLVAVAAGVLAGNGTAAAMSATAPVWSSDLDRAVMVGVAAG